MKDLIEVRIHGRGGQGSKKASQILGRAAYLSGYQTQDFAMYGAERKGAPIVSYVRFSKKPIKTRGVIFNPDFIVVIDDTIGSVVSEGVTKDTVTLINSHNKIPKAKTIDATKIALQELGKPIANIAMLGALLPFLKAIPFKNLEKAIKIEMSSHPKEISIKNAKAAKRCFELVK